MPLTGLTRGSQFIDSNGKLDTSSIYKLLKARGEANDDRAVFIWISAAPLRVQLFIWLLCQKRIQCRSNLQKKGIVSQAQCEVCNEADETAEHIISGCTTIARSTRRLLALTCRLDMIYVICTSSTVLRASHNRVMILWSHWHAGNYGRDRMP